MEITTWNANQSSSDRSARDLNRVSISTGGTCRRFNLITDTSLFGSFDQALVDAQIDVCANGQNGTSIQNHLAHTCLRCSRNISCRSDVNRDSNMWIHA